MIRQCWKNRAVRILALGILALVLLVLVWNISNGEGAQISQTEEERRIASMLCMFDEIEDAQVFLSDSGLETHRAVVIFRGEDGILIRSRMLDLISNTLGIDKQNILLYVRS